MSWGARRRFIIFCIIGAVVVACLAILSLSIFHTAPSCIDSIKNQDEVGVDCGGSCPYLCTSQVSPPTVLFTKAISNGSGRVDVVASVENKNPTAAAKGVAYTITLYGVGTSAMQQVSGTLDLPPAATVPVYVSGVASDTNKTIRAFLEIDPSSVRWFTMTRVPSTRPIISNTTVGGATTTPRIDAVLTNASTAAITDIPLIVFVHDVQGDVIAASQTIVPRIPAQGQATATFTWNNAFPSAPATIEVTPVIPLP